MDALSPASSSSETMTGALLARADVQRLLQALNSDGEEARIVGGAVRDALMGRSVSDVDIATTALPETIMAIAALHGWKAIPTGVEHGTVTLVLDGIPLEVTTLRRDVETDGRRAVVAFTRDFREDAFRRDFTINALSLTPDGVVHDYATGRQDAEAGIVRFMGDAETRIREDYLRILRFFRFFASHGSGELDEEGMKACRLHADGMRQLSRERIRQEVLKLLAAKGAMKAAREMDRIGIWPLILPAHRPALADLEALVALEDQLCSPPDCILRLAVLAERMVQLQDALKLSNAEAERITQAQIVASELKDIPFKHGLAKRMIFEQGAEAFRDGLLMAASRHGWPVHLITETLLDAQPVLDDPPVNPFRSADLLRHGIMPGARMGAILREARKLWLAEGLPEANEHHATILAEAVKRHPD
jgi:poly(A) polymerase